MSETTRQDTLAYITQMAAEGQMDRLESARAAVRIGYLLIGTIIQQETHVPEPGQQYFDLGVGLWVQSQETRPILRATDKVGPAVMCALFGDYNYTNPGQRTRLQKPLLQKKGVRFGWDVDTELEEGISLHADADLVRTAHQMGASLEGWIEIVDSDSFIPTGEPGHFYTVTEKLTAARIAVNGLHLRSDLRGICYEDYELLPAPGEDAT